MPNQTLPQTRRPGRLTPFDQLQERIDRMFEDFSMGFGPMGLGRMPALMADGDLMPSVDVREQDGKTIVAAELPGMDEKDIDISVDDDMLTISGEKKSEFEDRQNGSYRTERSFGHFSRSVRLPYSIDPEKVDARYDKGVLTLTVERPADAAQQPRKIEIRH